MDAWRKGCEWEVEGVGGKEDSEFPFFLMSFFISLSFVGVQS